MIALDISCHIYSVYFLVILKKILTITKIMTHEYTSPSIFCFSFHVGTLCEAPTSYSHAISLSHDVFQFASSIGYNMTLLDIGGGYPGKNDNRSHGLFERIAEEVQKGLKKFEGCRDLKVISEPGEQLLLLFVKV